VAPLDRVVDDDPAAQIEAGLAGFIRVGCP
jgi:hypothetical protein